MIDKIIAEIDSINSKDPNEEQFEGKAYPKELIYGQRMTEMLGKYDNAPSVAMQIAARGQHIQRWAIPRSDYPMDRAGYLKWRTDLKLYHGKLLSEILEQEGADQELVVKVNDLVTKKRLKNDLETQQLEDVVCLVFLKYYFSAFATEHADDKVVDIVQKTWGKMTEKGHDLALQLNYAEKDLILIKKALKIIE
ncbi:DUF4202 domain-containing protein [Reichenbachiella carrageenanivorans]|uniref:DUF4202 domain-containing protein n=1 Tax=Reichenbachiella carrageenanivorans TaxID=2979869 RepID=A0ABY6CX89_9BACT|nr:DUF4202 domain-containing protein [Reichenbachiella carrageenanivorans]UXX78512.1 DUF4202 domain-containing protein [Reichenbachiella carrageenanivorans]